MARLLRVLAKSTGYSCISLVAGRVVRDDTGADAFDWVVINEGQTNDVSPKDFAAYNESVFEQQFVKSFFSFVRAVESE